MMEKTITIQDLWQLLQPSVTFDTRGRYEKCLTVWNGMDEEKRSRIYHLIETKRQQGAFIHPNPCFALDDAMQEDETLQAKSKPRRQVLSFDDYYTRYGTTAETDGWSKKFLPEQQKTIYVK